MEMNKKYTNISTFIIIGFPSSHPVQILMFVIFLFMYILTIVENILVIILIWNSPILRKPMYFFLGNLSFLESCYVTAIIPKLLSILLKDNKRISFAGCMSQLFFFLSLGCTKFVLLTVMAFDRYVAICNPLHHITIMNQRFCLILAFCSWLIGLTISIIKTFLISQLTFCKSNIVNHFYCDVSPLLNLACSCIKVTEIVDFILALIILLVPLSLTSLSYICILTTILKLPESRGIKVFSTCSSHLVVVTILYSTTLFMYARPSRVQSVNQNKVLSIVYTIITPFLNPIIYFLRNKEVNIAICKLIYRK